MFRVVQHQETEDRMSAGPYATVKEATAWVQYAVRRFGEADYGVQEMTDDGWRDVEDP